VVPGVVVAMAFASACMAPAHEIAGLGCIARSKKCKEGVVERKMRDERGDEGGTGIV
jgi:hypothetical protein